MFCTGRIPSNCDLVHFKGTNPLKRISRFFLPADDEFNYVLTDNDSFFSIKLRLEMSADSVHTYVTSDFMIQIEIQTCCYVIFLDRNEST